VYKYYIYICVCVCVCVYMCFEHWLVWTISCTKYTVRTSKYQNNYTLYCTYQQMHNIYPFIIFISLQILCIYIYIYMCVCGCVCFVHWLVWTINCTKCTVRTSQCQNNFTPWHSSCCDGETSVVKHAPTFFW